MASELPVALCRPAVEQVTFGNGPYAENPRAKLASGNGRLIAPQSLAEAIVDDDKDDACFSPEADARPNRLRSLPNRIDDAAPRGPKSIATVGSARAGS